MRSIIHLLPSHCRVLMCIPYKFAEVETSKTKDRTEDQTISAAINGQRLFQLVQRQSHWEKCAWHNNANHFIRYCLVSKIYQSFHEGKLQELLRKGVAPSVVMPISKHKSSASLYLYDQPLEKDRLRTAILLDEPSSKRPGPPLQCCNIIQ